MENLDEIRKSNSFQEENHASQQLVGSSSNKLNKIYHNYKSNCRYSLDAIRRNALKCLDDISQAEEKLSLVKDFLIDPFVNPDSLLNLDLEQLSEYIQRKQQGEAH